MEVSSGNLSNLVRYLGVIFLIQESIQVCVYTNINSMLCILYKYVRRPPLDLCVYVHLFVIYTYIYIYIFTEHERVLSYLYMNHHQQNKCYP